MAEVVREKSKRTVNPNSLANLRPYKPGKDWKGNPGGRPKSKPFTDAIREEVEADPEIPHRIAKRFLRKAELGSTWHFNAMADRVEGKPTENVEMKIDVLDTLADRIAKGRKRSGK